MKNKQKPPFKQPRAPRCLYRSFTYYLLGIMSPSLVMITDNEETKKFWKERREYEFNVLQWKWQKRIATKEEWKRLLYLKREKIKEEKKITNSEKIKSMNNYGLAEAIRKGFDLALDEFI